MASEEAKIIKAEQEGQKLVKAYNRVPYALINAEHEGSTRDLLAELTQICEFYKVYKEGKEFHPEGNNGDYVSATLHYKMAASLIDKEARFLFAEPPDIKVEAKGDVGKVSEEAKDNLTTLNDLIKSILDANKFEGALVKAAKDCFIGKRVAALVNFNEEDGVTLTFLPATQFIYDTKIGNENVLTKFVCFIIVKDSVSTQDKKIFKKKFELGDDGIVYLEEVMYNGAGAEIEVVTERQETLMQTIPAVIFINDGLSGETEGESEIELLQHYEEWYSKLSNADIDAERKSMNPIRYTIDMDNRSTKNLSSSAGSYWDLQSDQNLDKPAPQAGLLEPAMNYSNSLKTSLDRMKTTAYEQIDMPNITLETMTGAFTSGKALKAVYWPLIVRCKEKMKMWGPQLAAVVDIIIEGAMVYPNCIAQYTDRPLVPVAYEVNIEQNTPLPEDEIEERTVDLSEVDSQVMSRKTYMKKWRNMTDDEVTEELEQIALERQIIEDSSFGVPGGGEQEPYPDAAGGSAAGGDGGDLSDDEISAMQAAGLDDEDDTEIEDELDALDALIDEDDEEV